MAQQNTILNELNELKSSLGSQLIAHPYQVPAGYFEGFAASMLNRIKALEAKTVSEELAILAPGLTGLPKAMPYAVPAGYFENLEGALLAMVRPEVSPAEELGSISPLLGSMKKEVPFSVPAGYFDQAPAIPQEKPQAVVVSFAKRTWFRYAAAAVITGVILLAGLLYFSSSKPATADQVLAKMTKDVKKMNDVQQENLIELLNTGTNGTETVKVNTPKTNDLKDLLKDVSDEELKDFQQQSEDIEEVMMTN